MKMKQEMEAGQYGLSLERNKSVDKSNSQSMKVERNKIRKVTSMQVGLGPGLTSKGTLPPSKSYMNILASVSS